MTSTVPHQRCGSTTAAQDHLLINGILPAQESELAFLERAGAILSSSLDFESTLQMVANLAVPSIADWCAVHILDSDGSVRKLTVAHSDASRIGLAQEIQRIYSHNPEHPSAIEEAMRTGRTQYLPDVSGDSHVGPARDATYLGLVQEVRVCSIIVVPLVAHNHGFGAITLVSAESGRRFGLHDVSLATILAGRAAIAVENARLHAERAAAEEALRTLNGEIEDRILDLTQPVAAAHAELEKAYGRLRRQAEGAKDESEKRFRAMFDQAAVGAAQADLQGRWLLVNKRLLDLYGYSWEELQQFTFADITHPDDLGGDLLQFERLLRGDISSYSLEKRFLRKDRTLVWASVTVSLVRDENDEAQYTMALVQDIDDRKRGEAQLKHQALHDSLTGLPNRTLLQDRLEQSIHRSERVRTCASLLLLDLDRFKEINDTFGHQVGDLLLQELGPRLQGVLRKSDTIARPKADEEDVAAHIARLGGDEFAILLPDTGVHGATVVADRILSELGRSFVVEEQDLDIGASIGIAVYPDHGATADLLLQHADVAMYEAKRASTGFAVYEADQDPYTRSRIALIADLRRAIDNGELVLHYQPVIDARTGGVLSAEALVRWNHPEEGLIAPDRIIAMSEHTGFIKPLTLWVLDTALRDCRSWQDDGNRLAVAVNLSARSLHDHQLVHIVQEALETRRLAPEFLTLEVTETAVMVDPKRAAMIIGQLHALGIRVAIDDFGTGYSSLSYLHELPAHEVKIDKSFVIPTEKGTEDLRIVRAAVTLAHDLGLTAIVEGVESSDIWDRLRRLGCDAGQGFLFAQPMDSHTLMRWLKQSASCTSHTGG